MAIVGIDGCGKSTCYGKTLYRIAKFADLVGRANAVNVAVAKLAPRYVVTDGSALVNAAAWGSYYHPRYFETDEFLRRLHQAYETVIGIMIEEFGCDVLRIEVDDIAPTEIANTIAARPRASRQGAPEPMTDELTELHVVATTISGGVGDWRKLGSLGTEFEKRWPGRVEVHVVDSHAEAREKTREIVAAGGRILVSAGGPERSTACSKAVTAWRVFGTGFASRS